MSKPIFDRSNKLLEDVVYCKITKHKTFIHMKSFFDDAWYNFITPQVSANEFNWQEASSLISSENSKKVSLSYYISQKLLNEYKKELKKNLGSDIYIYKKLEDEGEIRSGIEFVEVNDDNIRKFNKIAVECFPGWSNTEKYSRHFLELSKKHSDKVSKNFLMKIEGEFVGIGCIVIWKKGNLSYLHNMGTIKKQRRKGLFLEFSKYLCNQSLKRKVDEVYALVEEDSGSYNGFKKLAFEVQEKYHLFDSKSSSR